ncbi:anaphase-promoting complex subunit 11 [Vitis riparia]|uniref:anaphase-promoting complex subunit 11 n=1 Tax=Vitis riparia TaxID=96939 RepID=UPI00155A47EE|nr:anaphase-promoting complex subunit 11 [Vitis riparia]
MVQHDLFCAFCRNCFPLTYSLVNAAWLSNRVCSLNPLYIRSYLNSKYRIFGTDFYIWWHAVASWTWDAQDETCGICRMAFDGCCPDCKLPGDDCPLIWGACNHAFHLHCILKWVNSQTPQAHCPMCRREWQFKG